jgi:type II secretory pathway pseudopilin PulG
MKRNGSEIIEVIFVIVILGILAAVVIPKLMNEKVQGTEFEGVVKSITKTVSEAQNELIEFNLKHSKYTKDEIDAMLHKQVFMESEIKYLKAQNTLLKSEVQTLKNIECNTPETLTPETLTPESSTPDSDSNYIGTGY